MDFLQSFFSDDADDWQVQLVLFILTSLIVAGLALGARSWNSYDPVQRLRTWWNTVPTTALASAVPTIADNHDRNQILPGHFVVEGGTDQGTTPEDFTKPFSKFTEEDVGNILNGWRQCREARAVDAAVCRERNSQFLAEARNARQTERVHFAAEALRADAAESRAEKAESDLRAHNRRLIIPPTFISQPGDTRKVRKLERENEALQRDLDDFRKAKSRSIRPKEIEEYKEQLQKAQRDARVVQNALHQEQRGNRNIRVRLGNQEEAKRRIEKQKQTVEDQKKIIETQQADLQQFQVDLRAHQVDTARLQSMIDRQAEAFEQYETENREQTDSINTQNEALSQCMAEIKNYKEEAIASKAEIANLKQARNIARQELQDCQETSKKLQETFNGLSEEFQYKEARLEEVVASQKCDSDTNEHLRVEIKKFISEFAANDATSESLQMEIAGSESADSDDAACERCKTLQESFNLQLDHHRSQKDLHDQLKKQHDDLEGQLKRARSQVQAVLGDNGKTYLQNAGNKLRDAQKECADWKNTAKTQEDQVKVLKAELTALKAAENIETDPSCKERCKRLQEQIDALRTECKDCQKLQAEIYRLNDLIMQKSPERRAQQLIERDNKIKALEDELAVAKADAGGTDVNEVEELKQKVIVLKTTIEKLKNDLINSSAEIKQLNFCLEEVRVALCLMLRRPTARVPPNDECKPGELAEMLGLVKWQVERAQRLGPEVDEHKKLLEESNLKQLKQEIETLEEQLTKAKVELATLRPKAGIKGDPKAAQIIGLKKRVAELESQLSEGQAPPSIAEHAERAKELENELAAVRKELKECHDHRSEMNERIFELEQQLEDAANVDDPEDVATKLEAKNADLTSTLEGLRVELAQARQELEKPDHSAEKLEEAKEEIESWKSKLDACEARHAELTVAKESLSADLAIAGSERNIAQAALADKTSDLQTTRKNNAARIASLKDDLEQACSGAPVNNADAQRLIVDMRQQLEATETAVNEAQQKIQKLLAANNDLASAQTELELQIHSLKNTANGQKSNQNGEIQRLRDEINGLIAAEGEFAKKQAHLKAGWDHWSQKYHLAETACSGLAEKNEAAQQQLNESIAASFSKDTELKTLRIQLADAKEVEAAALADLYGEDQAVIDQWKKQLDTAIQERAAAVNAHASLQVRLADLERERDAALEALCSDNNNNAGAIENTNLRQQVTDLQQRLQETITRGNAQLKQLNDANNTQDQVIQGLKSKYVGWGAKSSASMVPQKEYDDLSRENILIRQEAALLQDWKTKREGPNTPCLAKELQQEQIRRVQANDRYNRLFPQIDALKKKLADCEDRHNASQQPAPRPTDSANWAQILHINGSLRAEINRNQERYTHMLADLAHERDQLLQRAADLQRDGGQADLADATQALRDAKEKNAELQAWRDKHEFMVQQADIFADADRALAAAKADVVRAQGDVMESGFAGMRGVIRKKEEEEEEGEGDGEGESPPQGPEKGAKSTKREGDGDFVLGS